MKKYLVIGNPVEHSLSPQLHNYRIKQNNINAVYDKMEINEQGIISYNVPHIENNSIFVNFGYDLMNWHFSVWGKNILNEKYATRGYYFDLGIGDQGNQAYKTFGNPSHFGISLEYNF